MKNPNPFNPPILCILGPTASGKSQLALKLAAETPSEIISVDSAQVYRGMDIGTAKPSKEVRAQIPHHLIDIRDPSEAYSAADFSHYALQKIEEILARNKRPLLVGGTMLYFKALQQGLSILPKSDQEIRSKLQQQDLTFLYQRLQQLDPITAKKLAPKDRQRIQRALEIYEITGATMSELIEQQQIVKPKYEFINMAINVKDRTVLHRRIEQRFDLMLSQGLVDEVKKLYDRGDLNLTMPSMRAVGYRQVWQYLAGSLTYEAMRSEAIAATRQLAKRQLTWLRSWPNIHRI